MAGVILALVSEGAAGLIVGCMAGVILALVSEGAAGLIVVIQ